MNKERKSMFVTMTIIIVLSGMITLGVALTLTMFSVFVLAIRETKRQMTGDMNPEDILWRKDIF